MNQDVPTPDTPVEPLSKVLIVSDRRTLRDRLAGQLATAADGLCTARTADNIEELSSRAGPFTLAIIDADTVDAETLCRGLTLQLPRVCCVVLHAEITADNALAALRAGAADVLPPKLPKQELLARLEEAAERTTRASDERIERLARLCVQLTTERSETGQRVSQLAERLAEACGRLAERVAEHTPQPGTDPLDHPEGANMPTPAFRDRIRDELDLEVALRATLEHLLDEVGPTNAAIYLPDSGGDLGIGAYVNLDRERDSLLIGLESLASPAADLAERALTTAHLMPHDLHRTLGDAAEWVSQDEVMAAAARNGEDTPAVFLVFRNAATPYTSNHRNALDDIARTFGDQLERIVHVHNRVKPTGTDLWDAGDMAA